MSIVSPQNERDSRQVCHSAKKPERKRELDSRCRLKESKKEGEKLNRRTTMVRRTRPPRPEATHAITLTPLKQSCEQCGQLLWVGYHGHRTVTKLDGLWKLTIVVRRCIQPECPRYHVAYRPEEEGGWALPHGEFGLEVIALIGRWRFREHRSVPEMHRALLARGVGITERSVTNLMQRYEELVALRVTDHERIKARLQKQARVILAIDGLQPDVGHEVLWVKHMQEQKTRLGALSAALDHFVEKTANFAPGLFHCYDVPDLPRTNNDLEHCFGVARAHERRATGRRGAIPGVVVRGSVRLLAVVVSTHEDVQAADLQPSDYQAWRRLRMQLQYRQEARRQQWRFRKNPAAYLAALEAQLLE